MSALKQSQKYRYFLFVFIVCRPRSYSIHSGSRVTVWATENSLTDCDLAAGMPCSSLGLGSAAAPLLRAPLLWAARLPTHLLLLRLLVLL